MAFSLRTKTFTFIQGDKDPIQLWNEILHSDQWHKGVYHTLCAAYATVSFIALVRYFHAKYIIDQLLFHFLLVFFYDEGGGFLFHHLFYVIA
jgi:hypothetical protein